MWINFFEFYKNITTKKNYNKLYSIMEVRSYLLNFFPNNLTKSQAFIYFEKIKVLQDTRGLKSQYKIILILDYNNV